MRHQLRTYELAKAAAVVIVHSLGIAKGFKNGIRLQHTILK